MAKELSTTKVPVLVKASARNLHVSPRKMRLVTNLVKNMNVGTAITQLSHANKKASPMLIKLLKSAVANAQNNFSLKPEHLFIKSITADMGTVMKRYFPRARGSAFIIRRKLSHINVVLEERKGGKAATGNFEFLKKKSAEKPEVKNVDAEAASNEKPTSEKIKKQTFKTDEEKKMNKVANKRRLFNRKTGE